MGSSLVAVVTVQVNIILIENNDIYNSATLRGHHSLPRPPQGGTLGSRGGVMCTKTSCQVKNQNNTARFLWKSWENMGKSGQTEKKNWVINHGCLKKSPFWCISHFQTDPNMMLEASQCRETPVASLVLYAICIHIFQQILHISPNYLRSSSKLVESCLVIAPLMPKYTTNKLP